ncbi:MAG: hypothetical protein ACHQM6_11140, partial [Candidatus Kapaibacterium sp.]
LQLVKGYRTDVSVVNISLISLKWYLDLFLPKNKNRISTVEVAFSQQELDSLEVLNTIPTVPERLYTDVDKKTRTRIHKELGIDVADKAEICFPAYEIFDKGFYALPAQRVIASILMANKWKRRIYFSGGSLQGYLKCTHVAIREGIFIDELYPVNLGQIEHLRKGNRWFHGERLNKILLHDARMEEFSKDQCLSYGESMMYFALMENFYIDSLSRTETIREIQTIPHKYLLGTEKTIFDCAQNMFIAGFKEDAKKECTDILPVLEKRLSGSKTEFGEAEGIYVVALVLSGNCAKAAEFLNSSAMPKESITEALRQLRVNYGCN